MSGKGYREIINSVVKTSKDKNPIWQAKKIKGWNRHSWKYLDWRTAGIVELQGIRTLVD